MDPGLFVGCAGWAIRREQGSTFPIEGTHLERYAQVLPAVEINSSFYRPHRPTTYARWATAVPPHFRFAVKVPRTITHTQRLRATGGLLEAFLGEVRHLGDRLGPLLVQLPPSLRFDAAVAELFFAELRAQFSGAVVCEPRHETWFTADAEACLHSSQVARVVADPAPVPAGEEPGGWPGLRYFRLHGSPRLYYSDYPPPFLVTLAERLRGEAQRVPTWCIFDNTAEGAALPNALHALALVGS